MTVEMLNEQVAKWGDTVCSFNPRVHFGLNPGITLMPVIPKSKPRLADLR